MVCLFIFVFDAPGRPPPALRRPSRSRARPPPAQLTVARLPQQLERQQPAQPAAVVLPWWRARNRLRCQPIAGGVKFNQLRRQLRGTYHN